MTIASGFHLFPFRTEKLSPTAPMVLQLWESRSSPTLIRSLPDIIGRALLFYTPHILRTLYPEHSGNCKPPSAFGRSPRWGEKFHKWKNFSPPLGEMPRSGRGGFILYSILYSIVSQNPSQISIQLMV